MQNVLTLNYHCFSEAFLSQLFLMNQRSIDNITSVLCVQRAKREAYDTIRDYLNVSTQNWELNK